MRPAPAPLVVGLGGSTRPGSASERVLRIALDGIARGGGRTLAFCGTDLDLPMYAPGADLTPKAARLVDALGRADAIIVSSPGYHGTFSGLIKNALDYAEELHDAPRPYFDERPVGCIACAYGWQATTTTLMSLRATVHALRGWPTPLGVAVNSGELVFDDNGDPVDPALVAQLDILVQQVLSFPAGIGAVA
jgi:FMN reductase